MTITPDQLNQGPAPSRTASDGSVNVVLTRRKDEVECISRWTTSNSEYYNLHRHFYEGWIDLQPDA